MQKSKKEKKQEKAVGLTNDKADRPTTDNGQCSSDQETAIKETFIDE